MTHAADVPRPDAAHAPDALRLDKLSVCYGRRQILHALTLSIAPGESLGLVGESGCGKSTVALAALRALPEAGRVAHGSAHIAGQDVLSLTPRALRALWARDVSMVYQDPSRALNPTLTVGRQLSESFAIIGAGTPARDAERMLGTVQIPAAAQVMRAYPHQLSGGMQQRVVIAMALAKQPKLLILDEPTTGLDATIEAEILDLIRQLRKTANAAILLISHNLPMVASMSDRIGVLYAGRLVELGASDDVLRRPLHPYTARLLRCLPAAKRKTEGALETIPGNLPAPGEQVAACAFAPRCARAEPICTTEPPPWKARHGHAALCHFDPPFPTGENAIGDSREAPAAQAPILVAHDLGKTFQTGRMPALDRISFTLAAGETLGLVGESGSGKTTLARLLLGIVAPDPGGTLTLDGKPLAPRLQSRSRAERQALQIVFQNPDSALNRARRVKDIVARPLRHLARLHGTQLEQALQSLLGGVRLGADQAARRPRALSGGLKQRVAIARAFAGNPRLVICDEPTSALDVSVQAAILNLLADLQRREDTAYIFISHDLAVIRYLADRIAVLYHGCLVEIGPAEDVLGGPHHPYTASLVAASSSHARPSAGAAADTQAKRENGCIYQATCPRRIGEICAAEAPPFDPGEPHSIRCHIPRAQL